jgi:hypothetical protein
MVCIACLVTIHRVPPASTRLRDEENASFCPFPKPFIDSSLLLHRGVALAILCIPGRTCKNVALLIPIM